MIKAKIFMVVTYIISFVCIKFNNFVDTCISAISTHVYDTSIIPIGINYKSLPIVISMAMIDGNNCTNKFKLLILWKWNFDVNGFTKSDIELIKPNAKFIIIRARSKHKNDMMEYHADLVNDTLKIYNINSDKPDVRDILFGEICLIPDI